MITFVSNALYKSTCCYFLIKIFESISVVKPVCDHRCLIFNKQLALHNVLIIKIILNMIKYL